MSYHFVIVDFTIDDQNASIGRTDGLLTAIDIKDGESCVCKANMMVHPRGLLVGSTMLLEVIHPVENCRLGMSQNTSNPAHEIMSGSSLLKGCSIS